MAIANLFYSHFNLFYETKSALDFLEDKTDIFVHKSLLRKPNRVYHEKMANSKSLYRYEGLLDFHSSCYFYVQLTARL